MNSLKTETKHHQSIITYNLKYSERNLWHAHY